MAHDAFLYFGRAYDVEVTAIQGTSADAEAGVLDVSRLIDGFCRRKLRLCSSSRASPIETSKHWWRDAPRGHRVVVGGELYSDALGELGTP
jgi:manganese/zinc/iron transport system substrate-binding protein